MFLGDILRSLVDKPPTIISPSDSDHPNNLIKVWSFKSKHILKCEATNADNITFTFAKTLAGRYSDSPLPQAVKEEPLAQDSTTLTLARNLSADSDDASITINGYYTCLATNFYGYIARSPPVRIIRPGMLISLNNNKI